MEQPTTPRTDARGICYGSGQLVERPFTDARGIISGVCPECGREVGLKVAKPTGSRSRQGPRCLSWHRPVEPLPWNRQPHPRPGRPRRKVLVDG